MGLVVSVVSHGHGQYVQSLLGLLSLPGSTPVTRVWLTVNCPEPELQSLAQSEYPFDLRIVCNGQPLGFSANHNQAFKLECETGDANNWFVVLNPDITWLQDPFPCLLAKVQAQGVGLAYPCQLDPEGNKQDYRRSLPTPLSVFKRRVLGLRSHEEQTHWVNAAFLLFPANAYLHIKGFDERYHLYCEDVDLCLRLQLAGYTLAEASETHVIHMAHRASHRSGQHLLWHLASLMRLWLSATFWRYKRANVSKLPP